MTEKTDLERARDIAVQLENENARLEHEHTEFALKAGERIGQADALAELRRRGLDAATARAERAEQQLAQVREDAALRQAAADEWELALRAKLRDAKAEARDLRTALDGAQQPECSGCGDTGACAGGPCAHPDAQQPEAAEGTR